MARTPPERKNRLQQSPPLQPRTSTFSEADQETLDRFSKDISDYTGRTVSGSAVLRALVRYAGQQRYDWVLAHLPPLIEQEMTSGRTWGKKK
jgi:hypothetical protein